MGTVNLAVDDTRGVFRSALEAHADRSPPSFETTDEAENRHRVWLVQDPATVKRFQELLAREQRAYVADGNHRSAAAAMLGYEHYLAVFFPASTMTIAPYNRLIENEIPALGDVRTALEGSFGVERVQGSAAYQPDRTHEIGFYDGVTWWRLRPRVGPTTRPMRRRTSTRTSCSGVCSPTCSGLAIRATTASRLSAPIATRAGYRMKWMQVASGTLSRFRL